MSAYIPELNTSIFSPADFGDADDLRPTAAMFDIGGNGSSRPYTEAINGIMMKHIDEVKEKSVKLPVDWKKRLREFLSLKNTQLLDFLSLSIPSHPTLGKGEAILRKFGNINLHPGHPTVKDLVLDVSGADTKEEINAALLSLQKGEGIADYAATIRYIYDEYRAAGDEALKQEFVLRTSLEVLDKIQGRLTALFDIDQTEKYEPLMEATEKYMESIFEKNHVEESYRKFIAAYRKFLSLRDIVQMTRAVHAQEGEPLCTVCLSDGVSYAISPCGHTFCQTCVKKQLGICFMCRGTIRDRVKLFFG
jgi:hypothetical protein